jgi:membrane associated rhomboid family serine protease
MTAKKIYKSWGMDLSKKEYKNRITLGQSNNALTRLLAINMIIFVILMFVQTYYYFQFRDDAYSRNIFNERTLKWFVLPADLGALGSKPWTIISQMFSHTGPWITLANMLWLWTFGFIMQDLTGNRKIVPIYIYGGLMAAVLFVIAYNMFPSLQLLRANAVLYGASASVTAIAISCTMVAPKYKIFPSLGGGIPLWAITVLYFIISIGTVSNYNVQNFIPHIAGVVTGFLFMMLLRQGYDASEWMNKLFDWFNDLFNPDAKKSKALMKDQLFYKAESEPYTKTPNLTQQRIDAILDKIHQKGFNGLTDEEKQLLERASKEDI